MSHDWGYGSNNGPDTWSKSFPAAAGIKQSPVDISPVDLKTWNVKKLTWKYIPENVKTVTNTGYSWVVHVDGTGSELSGGPLDSRYTLEQFHCHWGATNDVGSEHTVEGKKYAGELHLVHWNNKYSSFAAAAKHPDGLCVLGVFLKPGRANQEINKIVGKLQRVEHKGQSEKIATPLDPSNLIPEDSAYWTYQGSLTTPPCSECVVWILFRDPMEVSELQLKAFRNLKSYSPTDGCPADDDDEGFVKNNYRPPLPLGERTIRESTFAIMTSAMHYGWPSPSIPKLLNGEASYPVSNEEGSWIAVLPLIGAIVGALLAERLLDSVGRKRTILSTSVPYIASWLMIAFANCVEVMYVARLIAGVADGLAFTAVPMYLGEISDANIRGLLGSSCSVLMIAGVLMINGIGLYMSVSATALISIVMPILLLLTFSFMPESPYYSIMNNDYEQAKKSLKVLKGIEDVEVEINRLVNAVKDQESNTGSFKDLFTVASNRKAVLIMIGLRTVQQLSGISAITFYTQTIFKEAGEEVSSEISTIIFYSVQLILTCMSSLILDKAGRRPLMIISTIGVTIALAIEACHFYIDNLTDIDVTHLNYIPAIALICFIVAYSIGMGTIPVLMLGELFPTNVKAYALCFADIYFSIIAAVVSKFFQIMKDSFGLHVPFFCFTVCSAVGIVFVIVSLPETKNKTLEEIQDILKGIERVDDEEDEKSYKE